MKQATLLVSSVDSFSDCWKPFCHGLRTYWPDCPFEVVFVTNHKSVKALGVRSIQVGDDRGWSQNMLIALQQIETPYILYAQEDYWIDQPVNSEAIRAYLALMEQGHADYIRLIPVPPPDADFPEDNRLGILADSAPYRTSLQMALWRKSVLLELLDPHESPWQFELQGTLRSQKYGSRFLCVKRFLGAAGQLCHPGVSYVCTAIIKGRWSTAARAYARREGLTIDFSRRPSETWWDDFTRKNRWGRQMGRVVRAVQRSLVVLRKIFSGNK